MSSSKIEQIIGEIETYLDSCKPQAFSGSKKLVVEKDVLDEMLVELRMRTPEEIKKYQKIIANRDAILQEAQSQADAMIAEANRQTSEMVNEHEIMQQAYQQAQGIVDDAQEKAQQIIDNAVTDANNIREGAMQYTDSALKNLQTIISHSMEDSQSRFDSFIHQMQGSLEVVTANRRELNAGDEPAQTADAEDDYKIDISLGNQDQ
ncbi:MAG: vacuolar family H+-ATPase subunit H [Lachnospiraceae bacterium]|nr:vacuolar family H+-ATPase subunit H [Lachnospiraceae bacterium]